MQFTADDRMVSASLLCVYASELCVFDAYFFLHTVMHTHAIRGMHMRKVRAAVQCIQMEVCIYKRVCICEHVGMHKRAGAHIRACMCSRMCI